MQKFKRMRFPIFKYMFHCFKVSHMKRIIDIQEGIPLPLDAIIHDIRNFSSDNNILPDLKFVDKLFNYHGRYLLYHNNPIIDEQFNFYKLPEDKFRVLTAGMNTRFQHFKTDNNSRIRIVPDIEKIDGIKKELIYLINDNPLKNVKLNGLLTQYRLFNHLLSGILDKIYQTPETTHHYIPIQVSNFVFKRNDFQTILKRGFNNSSILHPNDPFYFLLAQLLTYSITEYPSPFKEVPVKTIKVRDEEKEVKIDEKISFIFHNTKNACIYTLSDIVTFFKQGNSFIDKIFSHLAMLSENKYDEDITLIEPSKMDELNKTDKSKHDDNEINFDDEKIDDDEFEKIIEETKDIPLEPDKSLEKDTVIELDTKVPSFEISAEPKEDIADVKKNIIKSSVKTTSVPNKASITDSKQKNIKITHTSHLLKTEEIIDKPVKELIESISTKLSDKQKQHLIESSNAWKNLSFNGKSIPELMNSVNGLEPIKEKDLSCIENDVVDKSYLKVRIGSIDSDYSNKLYQKDIIHSVLHLNTVGVFLTDIKAKEIKTPLEDYTEYVFKFDDINFKSHTVKCTLPNIRPDGTIISRGSVKKIYKQRVNNPICKISPTTVALFSDYNKYLIELVSPSRHSLLGIVNNLLLKKNVNKVVTFGQGKYVQNEDKYPLELTQIASGYDWIKCHDIYFNFNLPLVSYDEVTQLWEVGYTDTAKIHLDIDNNLYFIENGVKVQTTSYLEVLSNVLDVPIPSVNQWTEMNLISKSFPIGIILAYKFGLEKLLSMIEMDYDVYNNADVRDIPKDPRLLRLKLADVTLVFNMYPVEKSFILNGLNKFNLTKYSFSDLSDKETFYDIFSNEGYSPNYLLEINNFFDFFVDPAAYEILLQMNEPTKPEGILIRATEMLKTMDHKPPSSASNFRSRSQGKIPAILYNELTKQLAAHRRPMNKENKFSINPKAVYQRVLQDALTENADINNPIGAIKDMASFSYVGFGGRSTDSFVIKDRLFPKDAIGIVSEATVDSSIVAIRAQYSMNPNIINLRGMEEPVSIDQVQPADALSITSLLFPASTNDDKCDRLNIF